METKHKTDSIFEFSQFFISLSTWFIFNLSSNLKLMPEKEVSFSFLMKCFLPQTFEQFSMSLVVIFLVNLVFYFVLSLVANHLNLKEIVYRIQAQRNAKNLSRSEMEIIFTFASLKKQSDVIAAKAKEENREVRTYLSFYFESKYPLTHPYDFYDLKYASPVVSLLSGDFSLHSFEERLLKELLISPALQERVFSLIKDF